MHFLQAINSDLSVLRVCNKIGGTIKGDIKKIALIIRLIRNILSLIYVPRLYFQSKIGYLLAY